MGNNFFISFNKKANSITFLNREIIIHKNIKEQFEDVFTNLILDFFKDMSKFIILILICIILYWQFKFCEKLFSNCNGNYSREGRDSQERIIPQPRPETEPTNNFEIQSINSYATMNPERLNVPISTINQTDYVPTNQPAPSTSKTYENEMYMNPPPSKRIRPTYSNLPIRTRPTCTFVSELNGNSGKLVFKNLNNRETAV